MYGVAVPVAAVAETAGIVLVGRHVTLGAGARQSLAQHFEARAEEVAPALAEGGEEFRFVRREPVVTAAEEVILRGAGVDPRQVGQHGRGNQ